ncbi:hypothetical protein ABZ705_04595 [Streptomyces sp. NPDC006984]|uniref:hypothetical protein n=1 Tax=Streptomyces sp. NPDC006984 TaxID=3155463 RepID=UPI003404CEA6
MGDIEVLKRVLTPQGTSFAEVEAKVRAVGVEARLGTGESVVVSSGDGAVINAARLDELIRLGMDLWDRLKRLDDINPTDSDTVTITVKAPKGKKVTVVIQ